jgi:hypothetical protein
VPLATADDAAQPAAAVLVLALTAEQQGHATGSGAAPRFP